MDCRRATHAYRCVRQGGSVASRVGTTDASGRSSELSTARERRHQAHRVAQCFRTVAPRRHARCVHRSTPAVSGCLRCRVVHLPERLPRPLGLRDHSDLRRVLRQLGRRSRRRGELRDLRAVPAAPLRVASPAMRERRGMSVRLVLLVQRRRVHPTARRVEQCGPRPRGWVRRRARCDRRLDWPVADKAQCGAWRDPRGPLSRMESQRAASEDALLARRWRVRSAALLSGDDAGGRRA
jgi:hypothetical protein